MDIFSESYDQGLSDFDFACVRKFDICGEFARWTDIMMGILSENHRSHGVSAEGTKDKVKQTGRAKT